MEIEIKFFDENIRQAYKIEYKTNGAAAVDVRASIKEPITILAGGTTMIPTGFAVHMEQTDIAALLLPRSGLAVREGLVLGNSIGLIDSDFQQEIMVAAWNRNKPGPYSKADKSITINPYDRIAQLMFIPVVRARFNEVEDFSTLNTRGGFGSTGKS